MSSLGISFSGLLLISILVGLITAFLALLNLKTCAEEEYINWKTTLTGTALCLTVLISMLFYYELFLVAALFKESDIVDQVFIAALTYWGTICLTYYIRGSLVPDSYSFVTKEVGR